jgi:hypothetical protein
MWGRGPARPVQTNKQYINRSQVHVGGNSEQGRTVFIFGNT